MPVEVLVPAANTVATNWSAAAAGSLGNPSNVVSFSARLDPNVSNQLRYSLTDLPTIAHDVLSVYAQWRRGSIDPGGGGGTGFGSFNLYLGGVTTSVEGVTPPASAQLSAVFGPLARPGGGSWTIADVNALETQSAADRPLDVGGDIFQIYYYGVTVDYFVPTGFFVYLILSALGPLSYVAFSEMPKLARAFARATGGRRRLRTDELRSAWESLRAPRRVYA